MRNLLVQAFLFNGWRRPRMSITVGERGFYAEFDLGPVALWVDKGELTQDEFEGRAGMNIGFNQEVVGEATTRVSLALSVYSND